MGAIFLVSTNDKRVFGPNRPVYVGRALSTVQQAFNQLKTTGGQGNALERDMYKVGADKFSVQALLLDVRVDQLEAAQEKFIRQYKTQRSEGGYNDNLPAVAAPAKKAVTPKKAVAAKKAVAKAAKK